MNIDYNLKMNFDEMQIVPLKGLVMACNLTNYKARERVRETMASNFSIRQTTGRVQKQY